MKFSILGHCGSREWLRTISYSSFNFTEHLDLQLASEYFQRKMEQTNNHRLCRIWTGIQPRKNNFE